MGKGFWIVFGLSIFFSLVFALGGAGIYGSPFADVPARWPSAPEVHGNQEVILLTILAGPAACLAALVAHALAARRVAAAVLVLGAVAGAILGCLTPFVQVWEKLFLIFVWGPMIAVGLRLPNPKWPPT